MGKPKHYTDITILNSPFGHDILGVFRVMMVMVRVMVVVRIINGLAAMQHLQETGTPELSCKRCCKLWCCYGKGMN